MAKSARMAVLGRRGGLVGGRARARALTPSRRRAIARDAARARWSKPVLEEDTRLDLATLVAHVGASVARVAPPPDLEAQVVRAIEASHGDSALARMLPVFLWRMRQRLDLREVVRRARSQGEGAALGFFLETAGKLGRSRVFDEALVRLRSSVRAARPTYFFDGTAGRPFEHAVAELRTPPVARRWGLLMNMPWESFASHFEKTSRL
jgi:hypothetical protein